MKKNLVIISDLWGWQDAHWLDIYVELLQTNYEITLYDAQELANFPADFSQSEASLHTAFTKQGGLKRAVEQLIARERHAEPMSILAFSIGGTIAWKAALAGLKAEDLHLVSATRLRYEIEQPPCPIALTYGQNDPYIPADNWFKKMRIIPQIITKKEHEFYTEKIHAQMICNRILLS